MSDVQIPRDATAREILAAIDAWAEQARFGEPQRLWAVLTALRGPDNTDEVLKRETTAVIRAKALPVLAVMSGATVNTSQQAAAELQSQGGRAMTTGVQRAPVHFWRHIASAYRALER